MRLPPADADTRHSLGTGIMGERKLETVAIRASQVREAQMGMRQDNPRESRIKD